MMRNILLLSCLTLAGCASVFADVAEDATPALDNGWRKASRFGWYYDFGDNWISHERLGLLHNRDAGDGASYLWKPGQGWWYVAKWSYPFAYSFRYDQWFYVAKADGKKVWYWQARWQRWMSETQIENLAALQDLLEELRNESEVTPAMRWELREALRALAVTITVSDEALQAYVDNLAELWADQTLTSEEREELLLATQDLMASATFDEDALLALQDKVVEIAAASNIDASDLVALSDSIRAIIEEFRVNWGTNEDDETSSAYARTGASA